MDVKWYIGLDIKRTKISLFLLFPYSFCKFEIMHVEYPQFMRNFRNKANLSVE